jgi:hypothetical protein
MPFISSGVIETPSLAYDSVGSANINQLIPGEFSDLFPVTAPTQNSRFRRVVIVDSDSEDDDGNHHRYPHRNETSTEQPDIELPPLNPAQDGAQIPKPSILGQSPCTRTPPNVNVAMLLGGDFEFAGDDLVVDDYLDSDDEELFKLAKCT